MKRFLYLTLLGLAGLVTRPSALACAACFGKSDSSMAYGMNAGIMTLLVVILTMLSLIASFFVFVVRRAARMDSASETVPPSA